jgi:hypothetical protein
MRREDLIAFARRDWKAVAAMKDRFWIEQKKQMTPTEVLRLGDDLRRWAIARRPDWPSEDDRRADLDSHVRVSEMLQRAHTSRVR